MSHRFVTYLLTAFLFEFSGVPGAEAQYAFSNVDFPGADRTHATGINDAGQIVGTYYAQPSDTDARGFLLSEGVFYEIDFPGAASTSPRGINSQGVIVGFYYTASIPNGYGAAHSFTYSNGVYTALPDVPGSSPGTTFAHGINSSGQVVGRYVDPCFCRSRGFLLVNGQFTTIDVPGFFSSNAHGINDSGDIVGSAQQVWGGGGAHGYLLSSGTFTQIDHPQTVASTEASTISNSGLIAGSYTGPQFEFLHFVLENGQFKTVTVPGAINGVQLPSINSAGQVVGGYRNASDEEHGFLATPTPTYSATVRPPINPDGSSSFSANRGVVPVKFVLAADGVTTCQLPPASISIFRVSGSSITPVDEGEYIMPADTGVMFRIDDCQYIYNLAARPLGRGTYTVFININNMPAGTASFELK